MGPFLRSNSSFQQIVVCFSVIGVLLASILLPLKLGAVCSNPSSVMTSEVSLTAEEKAAPLSIVVLGASGDLAKKKTYPALFALFSNDFLPPNVRIYGYARSEMNDAKFRETMEPRYIDHISY